MSDGHRLGCPINQMLEVFGGFVAQLLNEVPLGRHVGIGYQRTGPLLARARESRSGQMISAETKKGHIFE